MLDAHEGLPIELPRVEPLLVGDKYRQDFLKLHPAVFKTRMKKLWARVSQEQKAEEKVTADLEEVRKCAEMEGFDFVVIDLDEQGALAKLKKARRTNRVASVARPYRRRTSKYPEKSTTKSDDKQTRRLRSARIVQQRTLSAVVWLWFLQGSIETIGRDNQCLRRALRGIGVNVPMTKAGGYWIQRDGNVMVQAKFQKIKPGCFESRGSIFEPAKR